MKKIIVCLSISISFLSFANGDKKKDNRLGDIGAYERTFTFSAEECLNNITTSEIPSTSINCEVAVLELEEESNDEIQVPNKGKKVWFDFIKENPRDREKYKGAKVRIHVVGNLGGYRLYIESFILKDNQITDTGPQISLSEFTNFLNQFVAQEGTTLKIRFLKIEK